MRTVIGFMLLLWISETGFSHPIHVSITNVDFKNDSVFISMRLFQDDFSAALIRYYESNDSTSITNPLQLNFVVNYLNKNFILYDGSKPCHTEFLKSERDEISVWYYFKAACTMSQYGFEIQNSIMIDFFNDQKNLVIINCNNQENGFEFDSQHTKQSITLSNIFTPDE